MKKKMVKRYRKLLFKILSRLNLSFIHDEIYLKLLFRIKMGYLLNLDKPATFNEKLQWLKVNDRNMFQTSLVDKFEVKEIIRKGLGIEYIIPTLGVWESFDEIDFTLLDETFVLKTTHDSGGVIVYSNKNTVSKDKAKLFFEKRLKNNYYNKFREWPYKNIKPRIIAEKKHEYKCRWIV